MTARNFLPHGSQAIAYWAQANHVRHTAHPPDSWLRAWEPFATLLSPARYFNACHWQLAPANLVVAEPWTEEGDDEPLDRTLFAFVQHPSLRVRAAMRSGEHFFSRTTVLTDPPPPEVQLGDPAWDPHIVTHAYSQEDARAAFPSALRALLQRKRFFGHIEFKRGQAVIFCAGIKPEPEQYLELSQMAHRIVDAALRPDR